MARSLQDERRQGAPASVPRGAAAAEQDALAVEELLRVAAAPSAVTAMPVARAEDAVQVIGAPPMPLSDEPSNGFGGAAIAEAAAREPAATSDLASAGSGVGRTLQGHIEADWRSIKGWVWDPTRPAERIRVELLDGETRLATTVAGENRSGLALSGIGDGQYGFSIKLADGLLPEGQHLIHLRCADSGADLPGSPIILDRTRLGSPLNNIASAAGRPEHQLVEAPDAAPNLPKVSEKTPQTNKRIDWNRPIPRGKVAGFADGLRGSYVEGWAIAEPDTADCAIQITDLAGKVVLGRGRATRVRSDLKNLGYGRSNFAFRIAVDLPSDDIGEVRVTANGVELNGSPLKIDTGRYDGSMRIEQGSVSGWVEDGFKRVRTPVVTLLDQDGRLIAEITTNSDKSNADAPARFVLPLPATCYGRRELVIRALVGGTEFARALCHLRLAGFLDVLSPDRCAGWLLSPDAPQTQLHIDVLRDGQLVGNGRCALPRPDVKEEHPLAGHAGFDVELKAPRCDIEPAEISIRLRGSNSELFEGPFVVGKAAGLVQAAQVAARAANLRSMEMSDMGRAVLRAALSKFCEQQRHRSDYIRLTRVGPSRRAPTVRRLNIVIPVYRGLSITKDCIGSVLQHRCAETDAIIVVNDCSPEPQMADLLASYLGAPNLFLLTNERNLGFVKSVNRALEFCSDGDVILLNSDTRVFEGGFDEMSRVANSAGDIGTVTAISNNATIFSYPHPRLAGATLDDAKWLELAAAALRHNSGVAVDVPTGHGFCLLLKREVLDRIGLLNEAFGRGYGEENDFCAKAADLGYRHVAAAGTFVEHRESVSFGSEKEILVKANLAQLARLFPEYAVIITEYEKTDDLRRARWALDSFRLAKACDAGASFALVIANRLGGGTDTAIADLESAVGYGDSRKLSLVCTEEGQLILEAVDPRIRAVFQPSDVEPLFAMLERLKISLIVVHQLLGFSADFIARLGGFAEGKRSVLYLHDFYPACPRVTMINAVGEFCNGPDAAVCGRCIELGGAHTSSRLTQLAPSEHRELFRRFMGRVRHVVAPSQDTVDWAKALFPDLAVTAIPHPQTRAKFQSRAAIGSFHNIVLLGAIGAHKGSTRLLEIARRARLSFPELTFHVVGYTDIDDELTATGNVKVTGRYRPEELPGFLEKAQARLALFLHGWPETFSYTLTEAVEYGLIPLVPDIGAPAARVRAAGFGVVFPFPIEPLSVINVISAIAAGELGFNGKNGNPSRFGTESSHAQIRKLFLEGERNRRASPGVPRKSNRRSAARSIGPAASSGNAHSRRF